MNMCVYPPCLWIYTRITCYFLYYTTNIYPIHVSGMLTNKITLSQEVERHQSKPHIQIKIVYTHKGNSSDLKNLFVSFINIS